MIRKGHSTESSKGGKPITAYPVLELEALHFFYFCDSNGNFSSK